MTYIIVGLGNPGNQYEDTRHNIGFMILDEIAQESNSNFEFHSKFNSFVAKVHWQNHTVLLIKPQTYMNLSGNAVQAILNFYKSNESKLVVVFDDLDQAPGAVKMRIGGGHGGHNGIRSILECVSSDKFCRIKVGIGKPAHKSSTANWVLHKFNSSEIELLKSDSFPSAKSRILDYLTNYKN